MTSLAHKTPTQGSSQVIIICFAEWHVLLTVRASHLRTHAGEVAFPGGKADDTDHGVTSLLFSCTFLLPGPIDTALRESMEEVGIPRSMIR